MTQGKNSYTLSHFITVVAKRFYISITDWSVLDEISKSTPLPQVLLELFMHPVLQLNTYEYFRLTWLCKTTFWIIMFIIDINYYKNLKINIFLLPPWEKPILNTYNIIEKNSATLFLLP